MNGHLQLHWDDYIMYKGDSERHTMKTLADTTLPHLLCQLNEFWAPLPADLPEAAGGLNKLGTSHPPAGTTTGNKLPCPGSVQQSGQPNKPVHLGQSRDPHWLQYPGRGTLEHILSCCPAALGQGRSKTDHRSHQVGNHRHLHEGWREAAGNLRSQELTWTPHDSTGLAALCRAGVPLAYCHHQPEARHPPGFSGEPQTSFRQS